MPLPCENDHHAHGHQGAGCGWPGCEHCDKENRETPFRNGYFFFREKGTDDPLPTTNAWEVCLIQEGRDGGSRHVHTIGKRYGVPLVKFMQKHEMGRFIIGDEDFGSAPGWGR